MDVDRAKHEFDDLKGKAKENSGGVTDDRGLQVEGLADQTKAKAGKAVDDVKDAFQESDAERLGREAREVRRS